MATRFKQGPYHPVHPEKYVGDLNKIRYMSSWELETHRFLDMNPNVLRWSSEEIAIPYMKPVMMPNGKVSMQQRRYFPDYWVEYRTADNKLVQEILEVKPKDQTTRSKRRGKYRLHEDYTYAVNMAKWEAAKRFCDSIGINFRIITERSIFK